MAGKQRRGQTVHCHDRVSDIFVPSTEKVGQIVRHAFRSHVLGLVLNRAPQPVVGRFTGHDIPRPVPVDQFREIDSPWHVAVSKKISAAVIGALIDKSCGNAFQYAIVKVPAHGGYGFKLAYGLAVEHLPECRCFHEEIKI